MIAPYISRQEYECPCCQALPPDLYLGTPVEGTFADIYEILFYCFQKWRKAWGSPIPITSGYRCLKHNAEVKGEKASVHLFGAALDCDFDSESDVVAAFNLLDSMFPKLRIGRYTKKKTFIHMDTGYMIFPRISEDWLEGTRWYK